MRTICLFLFLSISLDFFAQKAKDTTIQHIQKEQAKLVKFWTDTLTSPLARKERADFPGIHHFPINLKYRVTANLEKFDQKDTVIFATSSARKKRYVKYAKAKFKLDGKEHALTLYRMADNKRPEYASLVFLLFTDLTSNNETYGGGRYMDLEVTDGNTMIIDFNLCYQPYCAYSHNGWSCPIPPQENFMDAKIKAGVKQ